jgi:hypothetical protein
MGILWTVNVRPDLYRASGEEEEEEEDFFQQTQYYNRINMELTLENFYLEPTALAKERRYISKETYFIPKETYHIPKETYQD